MWEARGPSWEWSCRQQAWPGASSSNSLSGQAINMQTNQPICIPHPCRPAQPDTNIRLLCEAGAGGQRAGWEQGPPHTLEPGAGLPQHGLVHPLGVEGCVPHTQLGARGDVPGGGEVDIAAVLEGRQVLVSRLRCRPHQHHPVAIVLVGGVEAHGVPVFLEHLAGGAQTTAGPGGGWLSTSVCISVHTHVCVCMRARKGLLSDQSRHCHIRALHRPVLH